MNIYVMNEATQDILLQFTPEETQHPLFSSTLNRLRNDIEFEIHKLGDDVKVLLVDDTSYEVIGAAVDDLREMWMGDVVFQYEEVEITPAVYDEEGNLITPAVTELQQLEKDLSKCPCFGFTPVAPDPEPEVEVEVDPEI